MSQKEQRDGGVVVEKESKTRARKPPLYKVLLHNDDFTPRDFVVVILVEIFGLGEGEAARCMLHAHTHGMAVVGLYTHEIAETKINQAASLSKEAQFPLKFTLESE